MFEITLDDLKLRLTGILSQRTTRRYSEKDRINALEIANLVVCGKLNLPELFTEETVNFTANSNTFDLPSDILRFDPKEQTLCIDAKSYENSLDYISAIDRKLIDLTSSHEPWGWYRKGSKGYLSSPSDTNHTAILEYYKKPASLETEIVIPTAYANIIAWWGAMEILSPTNPNRPAVEKEAINKLNELIHYIEVQGADNQQDYITL